MKAVTLTQLKNNFSALMDMVKKGKTSLLVYERKTPIIKVVYAGHDVEGDDEDLAAAMRLERAGLLRRAPAGSEDALPRALKLRVSPKKKRADILAALLSNREEDR